MKLKILAFIAVMAMSISGPVNAADKDSAMAEILVVGKFTGLCGAAFQMVTFQEVTQMKGGDEFVVRFWTTEATRLGYANFEAFIKKCNETTKLYKSYYDIATGESE